MGWIKNMLTSTLTFDISQLFPSLILKKAGFNLHVVHFFPNYLVNRRTHYIWNNFSSHFVDINIRVGQDLALSPILLALYLAPFLHILEKHLKNLNLQVSLLSFINDGLLIPQSKSFEISNSCLYCSYNVALNLLTKFSLLVEHSKTKVSHFSRLQGGFSPPPLDLSPLGRPSLSPKDSWCYLGFIFDRKFLFHNYIDFYTNKAISTVKCMKILSNSTKELNPHQEFLLYKSYAMPIALYSFQLWYYNKTPLSYPLRILNKMQRRAALWIVGIFKMSPSMGIEAITGLIPINLHLQKIGGRSQLRVYLLLSNHIL